MHIREAVGNVLIRIEGEVDAAGERNFTRSAAKALDRKVQRSQRGRARGINGQVRPMEIEDIGHAVYYRRIALDDRRGVALRVLDRGQSLIVVVHQPGEDADPVPALRSTRSRQRVRPVPGILYRFPDSLQKEPLLGVHQLRFPRRDAEESRIETVGVVNESAPPRQRFSGRRSNTIQPFPIPSLGRDLRNAIPACDKVLPQLGDGVRHGIAAAQADHSDGFRSRIACGTRELGSSFHRRRHLHKAGGQISL